MIQGTMSNAGKSFLAAGLCRIFKQDGLRTAPFKSQNMALNSYITKDGLEMGRAQVMQAEAAGIEPEAAMNPILLKPTSNMGSQLIVNGEVRGNYPAAEYFKMKKSLIPDIMDAYEHSGIQVRCDRREGAGSPAEIESQGERYREHGTGRDARRTGPSCGRYRPGRGLRPALRNRGTFDRGGEKADPGLCDQQIPRR